MGCRTQRRPAGHLAREVGWTLATPQPMTRDYTKEVGLPSTKKTLPRWAAVAVLAVAAIAVTFGVVNMVQQAKLHDDSGAVTAVPPAPRK